MVLRGLRLVHGGLGLVLRGLRLVCGGLGLVLRGLRLVRGGLGLWFGYIEVVSKRSARQRMLDSVILAQELVLQRRVEVVDLYRQFPISELLRFSQIVVDFAFRHL